MTHTSKRLLRVVAFQNGVPLMVVGFASLGAGHTPSLIKGVDEATGLKVLVFPFGGVVAYDEPGVRQEAFDGVSLFPVRYIYCVDESWPCQRIMHTLLKKKFNPDSLWTRCFAQYMIARGKALCFLSRLQLSALKLLCTLLGFRPSS